MKGCSLFCCSSLTEQASSMLVTQSGSFSLPQKDMKARMLWYATVSWHLLFA